MIKNTDIRVGNYFQNIIGKPFALDPVDIFNWGNENEIKNPQPIKLTEDWCRIFKLECNEHYTYHKQGNEAKDKVVNIFVILGDLELIENCTDTKFMLVKYFTDEEDGEKLIWRIIEIEWVHELQNLYYPLHQKELKK